MLRFGVVLLTAGGLTFGASGCKKDSEEAKAREEAAEKVAAEPTCKSVAAVAQRCVPKAMDESVEELTEECEKALERKRPWAQASLDCSKESTECDAWNKCVEEKEKAAE